MAETIKKYIKYNILWMQLAGLWTDSASLFATKHYWKYSLLVNVFFMGTFNFCQIVYLLTTLDDLEKLASSAYVVLSCTQASVKAYFYLRNWSVVREIILQLDQEEFQPKNERQKKQTFSFIRIHIFIQVLYAFVGIVMPPLWLSIPFLVKSSEKKLPLPAWYPYDYRNGFNYQLSYVHQAIGLVFICLNNVSMDLIAWAILAYIGIECDILSDTMRNLYEFSAKRLLEETGANLQPRQILDEMNVTLIACIRHHWKILKFAKDSNTFFNNIIFVWFASSLLSMCMSMFELAVVLLPGSFEFLVMALYQIVLLGQLLVNCWFGNEVVVRSSKISSALYDSPWMDCPEFYKRNVFFVMLSTKRPIQMYGINFFPLSLTTFMAILRTCWSFFAMLYQVHNKDAKM